MDGTDGAYFASEESRTRKPIMLSTGARWSTPDGSDCFYAADVSNQCSHRYDKIIRLLMLAGFTLLYLLPSACLGQDAITLTDEMIYCLESDKPRIVLATPRSVVSIASERGPMRVRAKFADGDGRIETRSFTKEFLIFLEPAATGRTEILLIPLGVQSAAEIERLEVVVSSGIGPRPPPEPEPGPGPGPGPKPEPEPEPTPQPTPPKGIRVLFLCNEDATREQLNAVHSLETMQWLTANCAKSEDGRPEWRRWDPTSISKSSMLEKETPVWKRLWDDIAGKLPEGNLIVVAADNRVTINPLKGPTETISLLNRIKRGEQ